MSTLSVFLICSKLRVWRLPHVQNSYRDILFIRATLSLMRAKYFAVCAADTADPL